MNYKDLATYLFGVWVMFAVFLFVPPRDPPGAAPVRVADVTPSHYAAPVHLPEFMPLSAYFREPVTYEDRFGCPVSQAAVHEQGVGE